MVCVFTSAANNYLSKVKLLSDSVKKQHPEWKFYLVLVDEPNEDKIKEIESIDGVITAEDLSIEGKEGWFFKHNIAELCTAVKPFATDYLINKIGAKKVLYLDPDIVVFSRLDDLENEFTDSSILLTPHQTKPEESLEAIKDNEICSLRHGIFNLGFFGVKADADGQSFIDWWKHRLYHYCQEDLEAHLWTDQKWINFVPVFFEKVKILKDSRFNVAPWNITTRKVSGGIEEGFEVDGKPLGFYHFTGFDSGAHEIMANKYGKDNRSLKEIINWYKSKSEKVKISTWGYANFSNGEKIEAYHRDIYRERVDLQEAFPNPFEVDGENQSFYKWFEWRGLEEYPGLKKKIESVKNI